MPRRRGAGHGVDGRFMGDPGAAVIAPNTAIDRDELPTSVFILDDA